MQSNLDESAVRQSMLQRLKNATENNQDFDARSFMQGILCQFKESPAITIDDRKLALRIWNEFLRGGIVCPTDINGNWNSHFHVSEIGEKTAEHASRDPIDQNGHIAYLLQETKIDDVTNQYVNEALETYQACCYKASAFLIGAAVENPDDHFDNCSRTCKMAI